MTTEKEQREQAEIFLREARAHTQAPGGNFEIVGSIFANRSGIAHRPVKILPSTDSDDGTGKKA